MASPHRIGHAVVLSAVTGGLGLIAYGIGMRSPMAFCMVPLWAVIAGLAAMNVRCKQCGWPLFRRRAALGAVAFEYWQPVPSRRCPNCDSKLDTDG